MRIHGVPLRQPVQDNKFGLVRKLQSLFRRFSTFSTRLAIAFLLGSIVFAVVHRAVPFPVPETHPVSAPPLQGPILSTHSTSLGGDRGGVHLALVPAPGPQPQPTPAPTPPGSQPTPTPTPTQPGTQPVPPPAQPSQPPSPSNPLGWFFSFITGQNTPDSKTVAEGLLAILTAIMQAIFGATITNLLLSFAEQSSFLWTTPPAMTYNNVALHGVWTGMLTVAGGLFLLVLMWNGIMLIWRRSSFDYAAALEMLPRAILAFFLAAFSGHFLQLLIDLNNALCFDLAKPDLFQVLNTTNADFLYVLTLGIYSFMGMLLFIMSTVRLALIIVEFVIGPIACICLGSQATEPIGRLWLSATTATVFVQFLQAVTLTLGIKYLAPLVTGALPNQNIVSTLVGIAVLYLTLQIPRWLQQAALSSLRDAGNSVTTIVGGVVRTSITATRTIAAIAA